MATHFPLHAASRIYMTELTASTLRRPPQIFGVIHASNQVAVALFLSRARSQTRHNAVSLVIGRTAAA